MASSPPAVPARPAAGTYKFPDPVSESSLKSAKSDIASGKFSPDLLHVAPKVADADLPDFVRERLPADISEVTNKYRTKILGVDYSSVATALLTLLAVSRKNGNYTDLFMDLNLSVATSYTVSRDTSDDYRRLGRASAFKEFEIQGRTRSDDPKIAAKNAWTVSSGMNATALRLAGHLVVECAPNGGFLSQIKEAKGTPFNPVKGGKELEELMRQANEQLTEADRRALEAFRSEFVKVLRVMDRVWGEAGASTEAAERAAHSVENALL